MHQHPGLAATCTGDHKRIAKGRGDSLALGVVQPLKYVRDIQIVYSWTMYESTVDSQL